MDKRFKAAKKKGSLPVRGAWIEMAWVTDSAWVTGSLPVRGAWIEIAVYVRTSVHQESRSPCGERGLKSLLRAWRNCRRCASLPVRGAWIEMSISDSALNASSSLPVRGAWIEIGTTDTIIDTGISRSPCGERGLK